MPPYSRLGDAAVAALTRYLMASEDKEVVSSDTAPVRALKYTTDGYNKFLDPDGYPAVEPPWGTLTAIDLNKGEIAWQKPFGEFPELACERGCAGPATENYGGAVVDCRRASVHRRHEPRPEFHAYDKVTDRTVVGDDSSGCRQCHTRHL